MSRIILTFGLLAVAILGLFQLRQWSLMSQGAAEEWWLGVIAVFFLIMGFWLRRGNDKTEKKEVLSPTIQTDLLTPREMEVLVLIEKGMSNQEIAQRLFISETTVKSHVSKLLSKLDARRRTQAVKNAKESGILPSA